VPTSKSKEVVRNAQLLMPPKSVIERLSRNVSSLINYYMSGLAYYSHIENTCMTASFHLDIGLEFSTEVLYQARIVSGHI
jgi:hypothetical protein